MTDQHTTSSDDQEACLPPLPDFRVLLFGVDTAYISFDQEVSQETYDRLLEEQYRAKEARKERNAAYCSAWLDAQVSPSGANGFGVLIDKAGVWSIKVQKGNEHRPGAYLEMRSKALHTHPGGPYAATEEAVQWIRDTLYADVTPMRSATRSSWARRSSPGMMYTWIIKEDGIRR